MKKWICLVVALALGIGAAQAAEMPDPNESEKLRAGQIVEAMFAACAGVRVEEETALRKDLDDDALAARIDACAEYRRTTLPWLMVALTPDTPDEQEPGVTETAGTGEPAPTEPPVEQDSSAAESSITEPEWSAEDAWALFETTTPGREYLALLEAQDAEKGLEETRVACALWMAEVDHAALSEMNPDYACWLYCPDSRIDYPVVQGPDNDDYLHRLFDGSGNACGTLFVDYRNLPGFQDPNTLIYGHHMRDGSMFKGITYYEDQVYYDAHPWMLISSGEEVALLELFAGYLTDKRDHCYDIAISDPADMLTFAETAKGKSDFRSAVEVQPDDRLTTLSTCAYAFQNARYIAVGRLTSLWSAEAER